MNRSAMVIDREATVPFYIHCQYPTLNGAGAKRQANIGAESGFQ